MVHFMKENCNLLSFYVFGVFQLHIMRCPSSNFLFHILIFPLKHFVKVLFQTNLQIWVYFLNCRIRQQLFVLKRFTLCLGIIIITPWITTLPSCNLLPFFFNLCSLAPTHFYIWPVHSNLVIDTCFPCYIYDIIFKS